MKTPLSSFAFFYNFGEFFKPFMQYKDSEIGFRIEFRAWSISLIITILVSATEKSPVVEVLMSFHQENLLPDHSFSGSFPKRFSSFIIENFALLRKQKNVYNIKSNGKTPSSYMFWCTNHLLIVTIITLSVHRVERLFIASSIHRCSPLIYFHFPLNFTKFIGNFRTRTTNN